MEEWDVSEEDWAREGSPALQRVRAVGSDEQGPRTESLRTPGLAREARSSTTTSPFAFVRAGALNGGPGVCRLGEALADRCTEGHPRFSTANRQDRVTVVVCDRLPVFARGLAKLLEEEAPNLCVTGVESSMSKAKRLIGEVGPSVAVIGLSGTGEGELGVLREICSEFPATRVVVLLPDAEAIIAYDTLAEAGVSGYELKERDASEIAQVVSLVARGHTVAPAAVGWLRPKHPDPASLDDVEREILRGVARSETNRELAARLHLSERTVCRRLEGVYAKLHLSDRLQAAVYAVVHRLVTPGEEASNLREVM